MTKISGATTYHKKIFPSLWFGFLAVFSLVAFVAGAPGAFIVTPLIMAILGFFLFRFLVWDTVDEVFDCGDSLLFRHRGVEQVVPLADIVDISVLRFSSPERVSVSLIHSGALGQKLVFCPPLRFNSFSRTPMINELRRRVEEARGGR